MRLISFETSDGARLGLVAGERALAAEVLGPGLPATMAALLAGGQASLAALREAAAGGRVEREGRLLGELRLLAPVPRPGKVVAIGRNYADHASEGGAAPPPAPLIFAKWPSCVIGPGDDIRWDPALTSQVDYEAELAVVIGRPARRVAEAEALASSSATRA